MNAIKSRRHPDTGLQHFAWDDTGTGDQFVRSSLGNILLGRASTADEIAKAVLFLASDHASYLTGIELFVDGGLAQISPAARVERRTGCKVQTRLPSLFTFVWNSPRRRSSSRSIAGKRSDNEKAESLELVVVTSAE